MSDAKAIIVRTDGTWETVAYTQTDSYRDIKDAIGGGYLEAVPVARDLTIWCDEEGKLKNQPLNRAATILWWALTSGYAHDDVLCGNVYLTGGADPTGETLGLTDQQVNLIESYLK